MCCGSWWPGNRNRWKCKLVEGEIMTEAELDARFADMANDAGYQADAIALAAEFELSDWEAFQRVETLTDDSGDPLV